MRRKKAKTVTLGDRTAKKFAEFVSEWARSRAEAQGPKFSSVDFMCGAMCFYFFFGIQDKVPAQWVFGPLGGIDPFTGEKFSKEEPDDTL